MVPYTAVVRDNGRGLFRCDNVYDGVTADTHGNDENAIETAGFDYAPRLQPEAPLRAHQNRTEHQNNNRTLNASTPRMLATQFERSGKN